MVGFIAQGTCMYNDVHCPILKNWVTTLLHSPESKYKPWANQKTFLGGLKGESASFDGVWCCRYRHRCAGWAVARRGPARKSRVAGV